MSYSKEYYRDEPYFPCESQWKYTTPYGPQPLRGQFMIKEGCLMGARSIRAFQKDLDKSADKYVGVEPDVQLDLGLVSKTVDGERIKRAYGHVRASRFAQFLECADASRSREGFFQCESLLGPLYTSRKQKRTEFDQCEQVAGDPCQYPSHSIFEKIFGLPKDVQAKEEQEFRKCEMERQKKLAECQKPICEKGFKDWGWSPLKNSNL